MLLLAVDINDYPDLISLKRSYLSISKILIFSSIKYLQFFYFFIEGLFYHKSCEMEKVQKIYYFDNDIKLHNHLII